LAWQPGPRPPWVDAVNRGDIVPIADVAGQPLRRDALLAEAAARLGAEATHLSAFGDDRFLEPLDLLLDAIEAEASLSLLGRWLARTYLLRVLEGRLLLERYVRQDPGVRDEDISAPIFVTGPPRSGTTVLFGALAADPRHRVPEGWELLRPVPPPDPDAYPDPGRLALADQELRMLELVQGNLATMHEYTGRMPKECLSAFAFELLSEEFTTRFHVPSFGAWLERADMTPAYECHRLVLQILQRRYPTQQWVLKSPVHLHALPALLHVYPDARITVTHRDPAAFLPSLTSLVATLRAVHSDEVDFAEIGRDQERRFAASLRTLVDLDRQSFLDPARTHHSRYADFVTDSAATVRDVYTRLGLPYEVATERAISEFLAARSRDEHGSHRYSFDDLGVPLSEVRADFADYQRHFDVPEEVAHAGV
jgi:hypothetical protein